MIDVPAVMPVTTPVAIPTDALALLLLQKPPVVALLRLVVRPAQTEVVPAIKGKGLIVIALAVIQPVLKV